MSLFPFLIGKVLTFGGGRKVYRSQKKGNGEEFPFLIGKVLTLDSGAISIERLGTVSIPYR